MLRVAAWTRVREKVQREKESISARTRRRGCTLTAYTVSLDPTTILHSVKRAFVLSSSVKRENISDIHNVSARRRLYGAPNTPGKELEPGVPVRQ